MKNPDGTLKFSKKTGGQDMSFEESVSDEGLQWVVGKLLRNIWELVPQTRGEKGKFDNFIGKLQEELYRYAEKTKPVVTLF